MGRKYDVIVYGASGFTGKFCVEEIVNRLKTVKNPAERFTWAISGRSDAKLNEILQEVAAATGEDLSNVPKVIADVDNFESLKRMASQCSVVMNAVGPYILWGEAVVKACIAEGTHHVDLSGEPQFLEKMQLLYHKEAEKNSAYIVGACGFDSIPGDCGTEYLRAKFPGDLNSVESYIEVRSTQGSKINSGTWNSAVTAMNAIREIESSAKQLYPTPLPTPKYKLSRRWIHYGDIVKGWAFFMPMPDTRVLNRTQKYLYFEKNERPIQANCYAKVPNFISALLLVIGSFLVGLMAQVKFIANFMIKYPELCSFGFISSKGPSRESMNRVTFTFTLVGKGWKNKLSEPTDQHTTPPDTTMVLKVKGTNPGYGATCTLMLDAALTILKESDRLPSSGGVYTPGVAFRRTTLIDQLNQHGVTFEISQ